MAEEGYTRRLIAHSIFKMHKGVIGIEQLSMFNISQKPDDGINYNSEGKLTGIDIGKFSKWWEKEKELDKIQSERIEKALLRAREAKELISG